MTVEGFRALARSSPDRWVSVTFDVSWTPAWRSPVRATVTRPDLLSVSAPDGTVLASGRQPLQRGGWRGPSDGPRRADQDLDTVPFWQDYRWIAMLDPVELADGVDGEPGAEVLALEEVDHHGRRALEALVRPTPDYAPRCSCCPLLACPLCDVWEGLPVREHADAHRVRLDVETGICVLTSEVGGPAPGSGHDLRLTAVRRPPA